MVDWGEGDGMMGKNEAELKHVGKMNATVIPAPRKSVKRMMFERMVKFLGGVCLCEENPRKQDDGGICIKMNPTVRVRAPACSTNIKRIHPQGQGALVSVFGSQVSSRRLGSSRVKTVTAESLTDE
ncbi:hypothetical protein G2W53_030762 [Senna tora]|uniref:Uncharacterized protein n=1 Tax=Senna tora TaxID=362788 RepID=A0A834T7S2_9FABA|nr:hypothetical protein G2W53_030762 [Senna tora]